MHTTQSNSPDNTPQTHSTSSTLPSPSARANCPERSTKHQQTNIFTFAATIHDGIPSGQSVRICSDDTDNYHKIDELCTTLSQRDYPQPVLSEFHPKAQTLKHKEVLEPRTNTPAPPYRNSSCSRFISEEHRKNGALYSSNALSIKYFWNGSNVFAFHHISSCVTGCVSSPVSFLKHVASRRGNTNEVSLYMRNSLCR